MVGDAAFHVYARGAVDYTPMSEPSPRRRPRAAVPGRGVPSSPLLVLAIFVLGIALGQALNDGPPPPSTETYVRTLEPLPQQPATTTSP